MERRTKAAIGFSCIWVLGWVIYVCWYLQKSDVNMAPNTWGDFMAGAFAPLAFLWLVIAFFQQGVLLKQNTKSIDIQQQELQNNNEILKLQHKELQESTKALTLQYEEMKKAAEQAALQSAAIAANEMHARRDTFMRVAEFLERDMYYCAGEIFFRIQGQHPGKHELRAYGSVGALQGILGEQVVSIIQNAGLGSELWRLIGRYRIAFENLIEGGASADPELSIVEQYEFSPFGSTYQFLCLSMGETLKFKKRSAS